MRIFKGYDAARYGAVGIYPSRGHRIYVIKTIKCPNFCADNASVEGRGNYKRIILIRSPPRRLARNSFPLNLHVLEGAVVSNKKGEGGGIDACRNSRRRSVN